MSTIESKYLARFARLKSEGAAFFTLPGNRMLVEILPKEELKTRGGLIMATDMRDHRNHTEENRAIVGIVVLNGSGYVDDDGNTVEIEYTEGSVVLLSSLGIRYYSQFPGLTEYTESSLGMTRDSEVQMSFPSLEAFEKAKELLNAKA